MEPAEPEERYETNGMAFQAKETRVGPPLSYIAEKLRDSITHSHEAYHSAKTDVPDSLPIPERFGEHFPHRDVFSTKNDLILSPIAGAFRYGLTAYLALNNMLNLPGTENLSVILQMNRDALESWLDKIDSEGSLT